MTRRLMYVCALGVVMVGVSSTTEAQGIRPALMGDRTTAEKAQEKTQQGGTPKAGDAPSPAELARTEVKKVLEEMEKTFDTVGAKVYAADHEKLLALMRELSASATKLEGAQGSSQVAVNEIKGQAVAVGAIVTSLGQADVRAETSVAKLKDALTRIRAALEIKKDDAPKQPLELAQVCDYMSMQKADVGDEAVEIFKALAGKVKVDEANKYLKDVGSDLVIDTAWPAGDRPMLVTAVCAAVHERRALKLEDGDSYEGHLALTNLQWAVSRVDKWQRELYGPEIFNRPNPSERNITQPAPDASVLARRRVEQSVGTVKGLMQKHGLLSLASAGFFAGTMNGSSGVTLKQKDEVQADATAVQLKQSWQVLPVSVLVLETAHLGWEGDRRFDGSLRAVVGFRPVSTLVSVSGLDTSSKTTTTTSVTGSTSTTTSTTTTVSEKLTPTLATAFQNAFVFGVGGRAGWFTKERIEGSLVFQGTGSQVLADKLLLESTNAETLVATRANNTDDVQWAYDVGTEVKLFDTNIRVAHAEGSMANPGISLAAGYRYDTRFRANGALADLGLKKPEHRWYFRAMFDPFKVKERSAGAPPKTFDIGVGVEVDGPMKGGGSIRIPTNTRFLIRGDINVLKAASADKKEDKKDEAKE